jgi:uncharacterized protein YlaI
MQSDAQIIDEVAKALKCEPQHVVLVATALECSNRIAKHDFDELRKLSETHCSGCVYVEDDGGKMIHCRDCSERIVTELYRRMHTGPQPDPAETPDVALVARCCNCGAVGAAGVIDVDPAMAIDLGQIVQKSVRGFRVRIEPGPVAITGCACDDAQRLRKTVRDYSK